MHMFPHLHSQRFWFRISTKGPSNPYSENFLKGSWFTIRFWRLCCNPSQTLKNTITFWKHNSSHNIPKLRNFQGLAIILWGHSPQPPPHLPSLLLKWQLILMPIWFSFPISYDEFSVSTRNTIDSGIKKISIYLPSYNIKSGSRWLRTLG